MVIEKKQVPYATVLGSVLAEMREAIAFSQKQAADAMGVSQSAVARMELGKACTLENLLKAARVYGVSISRIFEICESRVTIFLNAGYAVTEGFPEDDEWLSGNERLLVSALQLVPVVGSVLSVAGSISKQIKKRRVSGLNG